MSSLLVDMLLPKWYAINNKLQYFTEFYPLGGIQQTLAQKEATQWKEALLNEPDKYTFWVPDVSKLMPPPPADKGDVLLTEPLNLAEVMGIKGEPDDITTPANQNLMPNATSMPPSPPE
eukprot:12520350-Ditylum_brightwellii.AAC.1